MLLQIHPIYWRPFILTSFMADLMDLMMIQNAQMHQVIMNNLAVSALAYFGHNLGQPTAQVGNPNCHTLLSSLRMYCYKRISLMNLQTL